MQEPIILKNFYNCGIIKQIKLGETFLANKNNSLGFYKVILTTLITSLAITGISCLDDKIWNIIMLIIGMLAYSIVGLLIRGKNAGKEAYAFVFIILLLLGYCVYSGIVAVQNWIISWPLYLKIIVLSLLLVSIIIISLFYLLKKRKENNENCENNNLNDMGEEK
jgi:uncharacterized membrane protein YhdT